jgi:hypothetical protein
MASIYESHRMPAVMNCRWVAACPANQGEYLITHRLPSKDVPAAAGGVPQGLTFCPPGRLSSIPTFCCSTTTWRSSARCCCCRAWSSRAAFCCAARESCCSSSASRAVAASSALRQQITGGPIRQGVSNADGRTERCVGCTDGQTERWMDGSMNGWVDG